MHKINPKHTLITWCIAVAILFAYGIRLESKKVEPNPTNNSNTIYVLNP